MIVFPRSKERGLIEAGEKPDPPLLAICQWVSERARIEEDKLDGRQEAALHRFGTQSIRWAAVACAA